MEMLPVGMGILIFSLVIKNLERLEVSYETRIRHCQMWSCVLLMHRKG